jgi:anthranilate/para-aminobenzoate synthase component I
MPYRLNLTKKDFLDEAGRGNIPPLCIEIPYSEPYKLYEALYCPENSILLESVKGPLNIAAYSFIAVDPYMVLKVKNGEVSIKSMVKGREAGTVSFRNPLDRLKELVDAYPQKTDSLLPPFQGGAIGMFSYDFVRYIEDIPCNAIDDLNIPDAHFLMVDKILAFDHRQDKAWIIACPGARDTELGFKNISDIDWSSAYDEAEEELKKLNALSVKRNELKESSRITDYGLRSLNYEMPKEQYMDIVRRAKEYIAAGDIFQANLSQRISSFIGDESPWNIYKTLRSINPSPFAAYADFGDYHVVSSSPERLVRVHKGIIDTRPIAGTRPRGKDFNEDEVMRAELLLNEKERAEHIMLIDLERNDIGKVCEFGTVKVDELMITEDYSHVIHIVSNVAGVMRKDKDCFDAVRAAFPGGTITGVPKVRCMEIIDELEPVRRGHYTGSMGYIGFSGSMDFNIIIRTFLVKDGYSYVQAGAGIVADSDPEKEYYETLKKAEALLKTLGG